MATNHPPHPYLKTPTLFIESLPSHVLQEHLKSVFQDPISATVTFTRSRNRRNRGALRPRVEFPSLNQAEKALAILHDRPVDSLEPPVVLTFSTAPGAKPFDAPGPDVLPRLIKTLPPGCTEGKLYDILRPYGPLQSVRIHPTAGGLVQFWVEAHARDAETRLASAHPKIILNPYDPCALFCSNISLTLDSHALRTHFDEFGHIISSEVFTDPWTTKSRGRGVIVFSLASEASKAMQAMDGVELEWKFLKVTYRLLKMAEKKERDRAAPKVVVQDEDTPKVAATAPPKTAAPSATTKSPPRPGPSATSEPSLDYLDRLRTPAFATEAPSPTTEPDTPPAPSSPPPQPALDVVDPEPPDVPSELEALRALYDAEVTQRTAAQAESAALRAELETTQRALELAESRLKILQLERDRPLWEAAKKKREETERAEEEERRRAAEVEESRRRMREFQESEKSEKEKGKGKKGRKKAPPKPAEWRLIMHEGAARVRKQEERQRAAELEEARCKIQRFEEQERAYERAAEEDRKAIRVRKQREMEEKKERERVDREERERREEQERQTRAKEAQEQKEREERECKEQEVRAQQEKEERERRAKEQREKEEAERKKQEEVAQKAKEAREREKRGKAATQAEEALHTLQQQDSKLRGTGTQDEKLRGTGPWTPVRALGRLKSQVEELDKLKFWKRRKASEVDKSPRKASRKTAMPTESRLILHYQCAGRAREEERRRVAEVEESRKKMQQFEEQVRRRRREIEEKQRLEKEEADRKAQIKFQREKRWKDATLAEEARCRKRDEKLRGTTAWTAARALTRLKLQIEEFDTTRFSETKPLTFRAIPWPVLTDPLELNVEQIDWGAVEVFFGRVKIQLATNVAEYNRLVEKVHRIFHPDKWKSRGLLVTVMDDDLKIALEAAGNVVAQAMTPLWRRSRGYNT